MNKKICGTYWLVAVPDGSKFITQGDTPPVRSGNSWIKTANSMRWLCVEENMTKWPLLRISETNKGDIVRSCDYKDVNFPDITFNDNPMEIEIGKSGRVYTYES